MFKPHMRSGRISAYMAAIIESSDDAFHGHTPIVAMTAHMREKDKDKCLEAGMDDFIPKHFDPRELGQKIAHFTRQHNAGPVRLAKKE